jgi:hypothetical protein
VDVCDRGEIAGDGVPPDTNLRLLLAHVGHHIQQIRQLKLFLHKPLAKTSWRF